MMRPKKETEDLLHSKTQNCQKLYKQTRRKPQETLEIKLARPRETFSFKPSIILGLDSIWMIGLTRPEDYKLIFTKFTKNMIFKHYTDHFDEFSITELKTSSRRSLLIQRFQPITYRMKYYDHVSLNLFLKSLFSQKKSTGWFLYVISGLYSILISRF